MFAEFSRGYYVGRLDVAPRDGERAALQRRLHERVNAQLYADEELARLDAPLVMKLGTHHLAVEGDDGVPAGTLEVPEDVLSSSDVRNPPEPKEVLLAKTDVAARFLGLTDAADGPAGI